MAISRDQVDEIKSRVSIIDVAAERVNLSRHGSTMSCCCPFHQEKTPSCVLYEKTDSFYCFGCGTSGDVISFIRGTDNLSYVEAVQQLAQRAGITIDAKGAQLNQREQELRDRIRACNREAARYFFRSLTQDDAGGVGRAYLLNERGLSMAAVRHFGLGYAKPESFGLVNYLRDKGFTDDEMITANLAYQSKTGHVMDRFRDRIMYPIFDTVGNVIAFGGRALSKEDKAKFASVAVISSARRRTRRKYSIVRRHASCSKTATSSRCCTSLHRTETYLQKCLACLRRRSRRLPRSSTAQDSSRSAARLCRLKTISRPIIPCIS